MVTRIDAVRYGADFDEAGSWLETPRVRWNRISRGEDPLCAARGIMLALAVSGAFWTGAYFAGRALLHLLSQA